MDFDKIKHFYKNKKVFLTGHTGFKGSWLSLILSEFGAKVYGYSLPPNSDTNLYSILGIDSAVNSTLDDIRDFEALKKAYFAADPDCVFHLAAQPIVRDSYKDPRYTYETNVLGTVNILECLRIHSGASSFLNVTTDKVYENNDLPNHGFTEDEKLDGYDPYSNSKSCSELVTHSYKKSFFDGELSVPISTARAGNVIGGGDFANDRIIPDCVRATIKGESIIVRNPNSTRPYQHVLEPLFAYLMIAMEQAEDHNKAGYYNIGPSEEDCINTGMLANLFVESWGDGASWKDISEVNAPHEAGFLKLDCSKAHEIFGWNPVWHVNKAVKETVLWYKAWNSGENMKEYSSKQIREYMNS